MANPHHLEIIWKGPQEWNHWRTINDAVTPDLSGADLAGLNLIGAKLGGANLTGADLSGAVLFMVSLVAARLSGANLSRARLSGATLHFANLSKANLTQADFPGADLSRANLSGANLNRTILRGNLTGVNLGEADLMTADLRWTNLNGANLRKANLNEAILGETILGNSDLSGAKGLDRCRHLAPSILDYQTLAKSGKLPISFLRGCGLPNGLIVYLPSLLNQEDDFYSCFISYSHQDKAFARRLHDTLQGRGIRCWLDEKQLRGGDDILDHVDRGIRLWDKVLLCCSKNSLTSGWVETELDKALEKEQTLRKERGGKVLALIPLDLDSYLFTGWQSGRASIVKQRLAIDFNGWEESHTKCEEKIEEVIRALRSDEHARERPPSSKL